MLKEAISIDAKYIQELLSSNKGVNNNPKVPH